MASAPEWSFDLDEDLRRVLVHGLRSEVPGWTAEPLAEGSWSRLVAESDRHRLRGLLVAAVASGALPTTAEQSAEAAQIEVELTLARMTYETRIIHALDLVERGGTEVRVVKGIALASLDYPDPQWRPTGDLDLLVRGEQLDAALVALVAAGGTRTDPDPTPGYAAVVGKGATVALPDGFEVDLHRILVWGPFGVRIRTADLWAAARSFEVAGRPCTTLSTDATLLHACYHLVIGGWRRALTLRDVAQLLLAPDLDVEHVLWLARRWQGEAVLASALLLARRELALQASSLLIDWAEGFAVTARDRLRLWIERPGGWAGPLEPVGTYLALRTPAERALLRRATFHPVPGTWPPPSARARRAVDAVTRRLRSSSR